MTIGAYAVERDYSHYVSYLGDTVLAVVGTATKGPINEATVCTSSQDLVNKFGPLKTDCYGLYAGQYFLSQSSKLYFVRAANSDTVAAASAIISGKTSNSAVVSTALTLSLPEKGTYGNNYKVVVSSSEDGKYTLTIQTSSGATIEVVKDIALDVLAVVGYKGESFKVTAVDTTAASIDPGTYSFTGGNDGIEGIDSADYITAANALKFESVDMNLCAIPGCSESAVITEMLSLAESRGDFLYLVDPPQGLDRDGVIAWRDGSGVYSGHTKFNSSYGALYYDWVPIYDSVNKIKVNVPPSVVAAATIAYNDRVSEVWYAPAGTTRGLVSGALGPVTEISKEDSELLYADGINPIYNDPQVGLVLWGQKTLATTDTALDRINVRRLMIYVKKIITAACKSLTFEPNDRSTWNSFEMKVQPVLESIQNRRGLYEYTIVRGENIVSDEDIDNYRMPCMVMLRPTKAAEEIPIYFAITSTGAEFNDVLEANGIVTV